MSGDTAMPLDIIVMGASGDLARRKIFPALFSLFCQGLLPERFRIYGFARSPLSNEDFRTRITEFLTCRYTPDETCADRMSAFLESCHYKAGQYSSHDDLLDLYQLMRDKEQVDRNTIFYLAIPPSIFLDVAHAIGSQSN